MSDSQTTDMKPPQLCADCKKPLTARAVEHGLEGFGHQGCCCDCYDRRMGKYE